MTLIRKIVRKLRQLFFRGDNRKISYSQSGEDLIVTGLFNMLGIQKPSYLDLGAYHPTYLSNTYVFYQRRCRGVCVEPNPVYHKGFQKKRKRDVCLNVGVGALTQAQADFFLMSEATLNTFSEKEAMRIDAETPYKIVRKILIPVISINEIIAQNFQAAPNFVSLDVEGLDLEILTAFDFKRWRPAVFCIETALFSDKREDAAKIPQIADFMEQQGYFAYADTYLNTIFVDKIVWSEQA